jgi:hypothetical protein
MLIHIAIIINPRRLARKKIKMQKEKKKAYTIQWWTFDGFLTLN